MKWIKRLFNRVDQEAEGYTYAKQVLERTGSPGARQLKQHLKARLDITGRVTKFDAGATRALQEYYNEHA